MTTLLSASQRADLHTLVRDWFQGQPQAKNLEEAEKLAAEAGQTVCECAFECAVQACTTRAGYEGSQIVCKCGQPARFVGYRRRGIRGVPGEVKVKRAYYHCRGCRKGTVPWDAEQGLDQQAFTPMCKALITEVCVREDSYRQAQTVLERHHHLRLEVSTLEEVVGAVGGRMRAAENAQVEAWLKVGKLPEPDPQWREALERRFYVSLDAGKAYTDRAWHDIKVAACYVGEPPSAKQREAGQFWDRAGSTRYLAIQEDAEHFGPRTYTFALKLGCERAKEVVVLGDGADWIWKIADHHFSDAVQILDFYHASEHVWEIARAAFGAESQEGAEWARRCSQLLLMDGAPGLLAGLRELRGREISETTRHALIREVRYFRRHRRRIRYPEFRKRGLMIGSGPVEAACKTVVGARLKGVGMRWSERGADAVLAARTAMLGNQFGAIARYARAA